jgi:beta-lactamase superfamily II metal-dependent hydrolase
MTILSVGENPWDLPDDKAVELYKNHSSGSSAGYKLRRTDVSGSMKLVIDSSGWTLTRKL